MTDPYRHPTADDFSGNRRQVSGTESHYEKGNGGSYQRIIRKPPNNCSNNSYEQQQDDIFRSSGNSSTGRKSRRDFRQSGSLRQSNRRSYSESGHSMTANGSRMHPRDDACTVGGYSHGSEDSKRSDSSSSRGPRIERIRGRPNQKLAPLPQGWIEYADPDTGDPYYYNESNGTTTWDRPTPSYNSPPALYEENDDRGSQYSPVNRYPNSHSIRSSGDYSGSNTGRRQGRRRTGDIMFSSRSGPTNIVQNTFRQTLPANLDLHDMYDEPQEWESEGVNGTSSQSSTTNFSRNHSTNNRKLPPLPRGWVEYIDPDSGDKYYYNEKTAETTWDRPASNNDVMRNLNQSVRLPRQPTGRIKRKGGDGQHAATEKTDFHGSSFSSGMDNVAEEDDLIDSAIKAIYSKGDESSRDGGEILMDLAQAFELGVNVKRTFLMEKVMYTFIGSDAVDWLVKTEFATSRSHAEELGRQLMHEINLFEHVPRGFDFVDDYRFYRFTEPKLRKYPAGYNHRETYEEEKSTKKEDDIALQFRSGIKTKSHCYRNMQYHRCFTGAEAVDWMVYSSLANTRREAIHLGQRLSKELGLFRHVKPPSEEEQGFKDDYIFYRFVADEQDMDEDELLPVPLEDEVEDSDDYLQRTSLDISVSVNVSKAMKKMKKIAQEKIKESHNGRRERLRNLKPRVRKWASSLHKLDPRHQIFSYFNMVKQPRDGNTLEKVNLHGLVARLNAIGVPVNPRLYDPSRVSIFTIWRPTSIQAIRKMMTGEAVGKGLDIKGKSAKRGKLSAFVPFLQIGENRHKSAIKTLPITGTVRLFFSTKAARDSVSSKLEDIADDMMIRVAEAKSTVENIVDATKPERRNTIVRRKEWEGVQEALACEMKDSSIYPLDDYSPQCFGIDVPIRLFWEAFITRQDITRPKGSQYDTGRPSMPTFQDKNIGTLLKPPKQNSPRAVLWQYADSEDSMNPFELLMAYEEHGGVFPVVSDFDAFLVGSQGLSFHRQLPSDQVDVLKWSVNRMRDILDTPGPESWTTRWIEVLENPWEGEDINPNIPAFGFGDPESYSIMEKAANTLAGGDIRNGAVRHGAECFNYYFPQELDDEFLVVFDRLPGKTNWKYMDAKGVQAFLSERIRDGFTFPLNPKWILCDGWGKLYDELMASGRAEVRDSLKTWFPPESGLKEMIEEIRKRHPEGFVRQQRTADITEEGRNHSSSRAGDSMCSSIESIDEDVVAVVLSSLAALLNKGQKGQIPVDLAKDFDVCTRRFFWCLDEYLMKKSAQLCLLSALQSLMEVNADHLVAIGLDSTIMNHLVRVLMIHGTSETLIKQTCQILARILPAVPDRTVNSTIFELVPNLVSALDNCTADLKSDELETLRILCERAEYSNHTLINSNGIELLAKSMKLNIKVPALQGRGCAIFRKLSELPEGKKEICRKGAIQTIVDAMLRHPESAMLQSEALTTLKNIGTTDESYDFISTTCAEDAILYTLWINFNYPQVIAKALETFSIIAYNPNTRKSAKMQQLTLDTVILLMRRYQTDGNIQSSAVTLLKSYSRSWENVEMLKRSLDDLIPLLFSAAENYAFACRTPVEGIMETIDKFS